MKGGEEDGKIIVCAWLKIRKFAGQKQSGMGVIEIILIIVVLIGLVIIFKSQITALVTTILGNIRNNALSV